jgi:hypothetical protein
MSMLRLKGSIIIPGLPGEVIKIPTILALFKGKNKPLFTTLSLSLLHSSFILLLKINPLLFTFLYSSNEK